MLREVFAQRAQTRVLETDGEDMQNREHSCFFSAAHAAKDSGVPLELAHNLSLDLPLACVTKEQYDTHDQPKASATLINPAFPSSRSKIATNIPAIAFSRLVPGIFHTTIRTQRSHARRARCFNFGITQIEPVG